MQLKEQGDDAERGPVTPEKREAQPPGPRSPRQGTDAGAQPQPDGDAGGEPRESGPADRKPGSPAEDW
jgi:hypothetical protein